MKKTLLATSLIAAGFALSACGGGGGGGADNGSGSGTPTPTVKQRTEVSGPLDALQGPLSSQVFAGLQNATAGTPLEGVLVCADYAVNQDTLDIVDQLATALQYAAVNPANAQAAIENTAVSMNASVTQLANDLQGLLNALASKGGCGDVNAAPSGNTLGSNPLAGTPLAPLGLALAPVLGQIAGVGKAADANQSHDLASVATLVGQLNDALQSGLAQIPSDARNAPVLGPLLQTLSVALNDLDNTVSAAVTYNGALTATQLSSLVDHLLVNVLTNVIPVTTLETQSGQGPIVSGQIITQVHTLSDALRSALGQATPLFAALQNQMSPLINPIEDQVLAPILGAISSALGGGGSTGSNPFAGTPLAALGAALGGASVGATSGSADGATHTPLDLILQPILDVVDGGGACPLAGTPLAALCDVADGLLGALSTNPSGNPLNLLSGVVNSVLGLLGGHG